MRQIFFGKAKRYELSAAAYSMRFFFVAAAALVAAVPHQECSEACPRRKKKKIWTVTVPRPRKHKSFLDSSLLLLKVPETGSSTAAHVLGRLAAEKGISCWGSPVCGNTTTGRWSLGHRPWEAATKGKKRHLHIVSTIRDPIDRIVSHSEKLIYNGENPCGDRFLLSTSEIRRRRDRKVGGRKCTCEAGLSIACTFWSDAKRRCSESNLVANEKLAVDVMEHKVDDLWVFERYNESLVLFALKHRLQLGDVFPFLSKYHVLDDAATKKRNLLTAKCSREVGTKPILHFERHLHKLANEKLDDDIASFQAQDVDVPKLIAIFESHLHLYIDRGMNFHHKGEPSVTQQPQQPPPVGETRRRLEATDLSVPPPDTESIPEGGTLTRHHHQHHHHHQRHHTKPRLKNTLTNDECTFQCAVKALNTEVRIRYVDDDDDESSTSSSAMTTTERFR